MSNIMLTPYLKKRRREFIKQMEEQEAETLEKYLKKEKGEIKVNWSKLIRDKHSFLERASEGIEPAFYNHILRYLEIKDILTFSDKDSFILFGCGMDLGPNIHAGLNYRFKRREDAEAYAKAEYKNVLYPVGIAKSIASKIN